MAVVLLPFSLLYGLAVSLHQALYASGFIKPVSFSLPVIGVGNLSVGGTGKSPHVEYLIRLLSPYLHLALLSRGYNRKTSGYLLVDGHCSADQTGDEAYQIKSKFPHIPVAVCESRALGIPKILSQYPDTQVILLDDAFQHWQVKPALNILLTEYARPYVEDYLLPSGRLREWRFGAERAHAVIVTKCPDPDREPDEALWRHKLRLRDSQQIFFSRIEYGVPYRLGQPDSEISLNSSMGIVLVSAIAQSGYLENYLAENVSKIVSFAYEDHHYFTEREIVEWNNKLKKMSPSNKIILTTEKDATRIQLHEKFLDSLRLPIYVIPIEVKFYRREVFDTFIKSFLLDFKC